MQSTNGEQAAGAVADETAVMLDEILDVALRQNAQDRQFILETESAVIEFLQQPLSRRLAFPRQNSYRRLLLHRVGEYYGVNHVVVGKGRDEMAFYKKTQPQHGEDPAVLDTTLPVPLALCVLYLDPPVNEGVGGGDEAQQQQQQGFTRILAKKDTVPRNGDGNVEGAHPEAQSIDSARQRKDEYARARAEIFQEQ
ncbi:R3H domain-containing protein 2 [Coemansia sp. RSA 2049]|nr:R3H domain-containing protein 2 [Coemansia sp. RSA 1939]KAJ2524770.1 R3H domain-containing protein 2 [Coemansia sp. RSA 2049]KAJ2607411.1 R3H domain-containing protein 2 [Coemansia sp. RSA 1804]KAJ2693398.1 R3H domain-containing protein 2 [Coemansia sp. RSA 1285]